MRLLISFTALFLSVIFTQLGAGGVAPLDAVSGLALGFTTAQVGLLGSAHFLGFFAGCWWAPRLMGSVGHSRAFAAFTAMGTIGIAAHMMIVEPNAWALMRTLTGLSVAGCYTIVEAWLQASVTNETRGRAMATYRVVDVGASLAAQLMIGVLEPSAYASYNLLAILACAALLPMALTKAKQPATPSAPRLRPLLAWRMSPLAAVMVVVSGLTGAAFRFVGPVYGAAVGLRLDQIGIFLAAYVAGGWVAQIPVGWLADRFDRRSVLLGLSIGTLFASGLVVGAAQLGAVPLFAAAAIFGFATLTLYSVASAHANDFAETHERVELSAALMFLYAVGAIASPVGASWLIGRFGPTAMFAAIALIHVATVAFALTRMRARPAPEVGTRTAYAWVPRTSFTIGRLLGRHHR
ncbi:MFS transporter [Frigidibacter sp. MR17.24]|uniref:MFS transporter n=1 Tax=Frigidibacter sp. MR17.24 TaxID=3127345 RepID=UPI003012DB51